MNMDGILQTLGRLSLEASALIAVVLLLRWLMGPKLSAGWRVTLWALVALKLVLLAVLPVGFGVGQTQEVSAVAEVVVVQERSVTSVGSVGSQEVPAESLPVLLMLWLTGAVAVLSIAIWRHWRYMQNLKLNASTRAASPEIRRAASQAGLRRLPRVWISSEVVVPAVTGIFRCSLILPGQAVQHQVVLHELFHLKHQDIAVNWAWMALLALHWFNPLVWLAASRCQEDRELRCDEAALRFSSAAERIAYGRELLRLQENFIAPPALAGVAACVRNHPPLRQRILMITQPTTTQPWAKYALTALTLGLASIFFGTAQAEEEKSRTREGERSSRTPAIGERGEEVRKSGTREGEKTAMGEREGERGKSREGEGADRGKREGGGDREGAKTGLRDGDKPRTGMRDGEGEGRRGPRDGEGERGAARDGERGKSAEGRVSGRGRESGSGKTIVLRVIDGGNQVQVGEDKVAIGRLRGHLQSFLPQNAGSPVVIQADDDVPFKAVSEVLDAARDNGAKGATIQAATRER